MLSVDLVGFGETGRHGRPVSLPANQLYLNRFLRQVADAPVIIIGHSMGATIAVMQAARHPGTVAGLILINPAIPWQFEDPASPIMAGAIGALALAMAVRPGLESHERSEHLRRLLGEFMRVRYPNLLPAAMGVVTNGIRNRGAGHGAAEPGNRAAFLSLFWTLARRWRFASTAADVRAPVLLLHGDRDRLVPPGAIAAIAAANPAWRLRVAHRVGHFPPREVPDWTMSNILAWLADSGNLGPAVLV